MYTFFYKGAGMNKKVLFFIACIISMQQIKAVNEDWMKVAFPVVAALVGGVGKQLWDKMHEGTARNLVPVLDEVRLASIDGKHGDARTVGLQAAGASAHVKVPTTFDLAAAWQTCTPKLEAGIANKHDKALPVEQRTANNVQKCLYVQASLGPDCKLEGRWNISNVIVSFVTVAATLAAKTMMG